MFEKLETYLLNVKRNFINKKRNLNVKKIRTSDYTRQQMVFNEIKSYENQYNMRRGNELVWNKYLYKLKQTVQSVVKSTSK